MSDTETIIVELLSLEPLPSKKVLAIASVQVTISEIPIHIHGITVRSTYDPTSGKPATAVELPTHRSKTGEMKASLQLPEELKEPISEVVLEEACRVGITKIKSQ